MSTQSQDSSDAQQDSSGAKADEDQGDADPQQETKGKWQPLKKGDIDAAQTDSREAGEHTAADISSGGERTETEVQLSSGDTNKDRRKAEPADISRDEQQDGAASAVPDKQKVDEKEDGGGLGEGIWVIDLTVNDPAALKDGEDTYMVCPFHLPYMHCMPLTGRAVACLGWKPQQLGISHCSSGVPPIAQVPAC